MNREDIKEGIIVRVNSEGDLMMCKTEKPFIGNYVTIVKLTKAGMVQVRYDNKLYLVRPSNLDYEPDIT